MVKVNRINTSQIEGDYSNDSDKRPNGEMALYNDDNGGFDLVIHDGVNSTNLNKVLGKGKLYGHGADSADGNGYDTIKLIPDIPAYNDGSHQYLIIDPTGPNHVHLRAGGPIDNSNSELIVGGENSNIKVGAGADPEISIKSNNNAWDFTTSGDLQFPSQLLVSPLSNFVPAYGTVIQQASGQILNVLSVGSGGFMAAGWVENTFGPGDVTSISFNEVPGDVRISTGSFDEVVNTWIYDSIGNLTMPGNIILSNDSKVATGAFDNGTSGNSGISLVCSVGYELNWQGGHLISTQDGGTTAANILCDSAIELPGNGIDNVEINNSGIIFSDGTSQNTAWTGSITSSQVSDFNSSVSGLLPVKDILSGSGISVSSNSGIYTITSAVTSVAESNSLVTRVFNKTGNPIPKFSAVYINGGQGDQATIQLAIASNEGGSSKTYGITAEAIDNMSAGKVIIFGALTGVNTDQFNPTAPTGDVNGVPIYLSPSVSGGITTTKPLAPNHLVSLGKIVRTHQNAGVVEVSVQNGFELYELHDVAISGVAHNDVLVYNSGVSLWQNNSNVVFSDTNGISGGSGINNMVCISQANYDAIVTKDPNTLYFIT